METVERRNLEGRLAQLLDEHATVKLATSSPEGVPWVATAYFVGLGPYALALMLEAQGRTMTNIRANPEVAMMVEDGDAMALFAQAEGRAAAVAGAAERFRDAIAQKTPESAPLVGLPGLLPVRIDVRRWKLTHVPGGWLPGRELTPAQTPSPLDTV